MGFCWVARLVTAGKPNHQFLGATSSSVATLPAYHSLPGFNWKLSGKTKRPDTDSMKYWLFNRDPYIWVFPKIGVPQNGWFIMENPIKMDDLGGTTIFGNTHMSIIPTQLCRFHPRHIPEKQQKNRGPSFIVDPAISPTLRWNSTH